MKKFYFQVFQNFQKKEPSCPANMSWEDNNNFKDGIKSKYQLIEKVTFSRARIKEAYPKNVVIIEYYTKAICEDFNRKGEVYLFENEFINYLNK